MILGVAAAASYIRARDLPWVPDLEALEAKRQRHETLRAGAAVDLERFQLLVEQCAVVVIDARSQAAFEEGHLAVDCDPPVLNVPSGEVDAHTGRLMELLGLPVVLYCASQTCDDAEELYAALQQLGFAEIWIYFPGWDGILDVGLKTTTGPDTWTGFGGAPLEPPVDEDGAYGDDELLDANTADEVEP